MMTSSIISLLLIACLNVMQGSGTSPSSSSGAQVGSSSSGALAPKGFRRFHANDSFIGRPVPCTHQEKLCFRHNMLYYPWADKCARPKYCRERFTADRDEFLRGSGHLFAVCPLYADRCDGHRMAYDGVCYTGEVVREICGCAAKPTRHFLGDVECRCSPATPIHVEQPEEEGRCRIPDLRFPDYNFSDLRSKPYENLPPYLNTSTEQKTCSFPDEVWVSEAKGCFPLLARGPCLEDHIVALDFQAALQGHALAACAHERGGCPPGHQRVPYDGPCHSDTYLQVIWPGVIRKNCFGHSEASYIYSDYHPPYISLYDDSQACATISVPLSPPTTLAIPPALTLCAPNDRSECTHYVVEDKVPARVED